MTTLQQILDEVWAKDMMTIYYPDVEQAVKLWLQQQQPKEPVDYNHMCKGEYEAYHDGKEAFYDDLLAELEAHKK